MSTRAALALAALWLLLALPAHAQAGFGIAEFEVAATEADGALATLAGSHPYQLTTEIGFEQGPESPGEPGVPFSDGDVRDIRIDLPAGVVENPAAVAKCPQVLFHAPRVSPFGETRSGESCPGNSQVGVVEVRSSVGAGSARTFGVFNLTPPPGAPSQLGFSPYGAAVTLAPQIREAGGEYGLTLRLRDFPQQFDLTGLEMTLWGVPWDLRHDTERGNCLNEADPSEPFAKCSVGPPHLNPKVAYLTLPTECESQLAFRIAASSWQGGPPATASSTGPSLAGCDALPFQPKPLARLSTARTTSSSGYDFTLDGNSEGLLDPTRRAGSQVKKATLALPPGMTVNPSVGAGLGVCTPAQYAAETATSPPGAACPNDSKIGEASVESPLFEGAVKGSLYLAQPDDPATGTRGAENPFDAMIALYIVAKSPERGILVRVAGRVGANPATGQLVATFDNLPQLPYTHFNVNFRDGQRSPLATPAGCGDHFTQIDFTSWLAPGIVRHDESRHQLTAGIGGGPCPNGSVPPFTPAGAAGTLNRNAGSYTPFHLRLTRGDAEQEITSYSAQLPPGLLGRIKGIPFCPEAAIAAAKAKRGFEELAEPSCPAASQIGRTYSGYGLGSVLAYAPGRLYLAGPYNGSPLSVLAVNAATVGPFDLGVITVRSAIRVDPRTAQVSVDSAGSDAIPHILAGIPLHLRDVRVYMDRPGFTLNPTSCDHFAVTSGLTGSGASFATPADDSRAAAPSHFQVSNCSALGFRPRLTLELRGGTKRGDFPALKATVRPRPGDANIGRVSVALPPSEFLEQEHIGTICTRPQSQAERCPPGSIYGRAKAFTPLLSEPLEGPVYLRASDNPLPDLVADLKGSGIRIEVSGRIDSKGGGLRATYDVLPDAPVSKFVMSLNGGKRGLLANSENTCTASAPALARMAGQNNRPYVAKPRLSNTRCAKGRGKGKGARR